MIRSLAGRALGCLLCPVVAWGQVAASSQTTFQVTTRIVYVDVVVRDGLGHIVRGLTEKDFRVAEDGKEQHIDFFRDHTHDAVTTATGASPGGGMEYSNVSSGGEAVNSVNIILFDFLNTAPQDQSYARTQMIRFLEELPPGRQTALFVLGGKLRMIQGFTGSTDRLLAAARAMKIEASSVKSVGQEQEDMDVVNRMVSAMGRAPSGGAVGDMFKNESGQDEQRASSITSEALQQLVAAVSGYPGRKNLFWLADTFPLYGGPMLEINDLSAAMNRNTMDLRDEAEANHRLASAQIALYPISLIGLQVGGSGAETSLAPNGTELRRQFNDRAALHAMLNKMADDTGGRAYYGTNDFAGALKRGFEDGSSYYTLAYRPENHKWNGKFRTIEVHVAGHHYSLDYRRGYFAAPERTVPATNVSQQLNEALQPDTPEATMLLLKAKVELPDAAAKGAGHAAVRVDSVIDPGNVDFETDARGRRHARLLVSLIALPDPEPGAKVVVSKGPVQPPQTSGMYVVDVDEAGFRKLLAEGMPAQQEMALAPGRYRLRLGVCDLGNRRVGTLDMAVVVKDRE